MTVFGEKVFTDIVKDVIGNDPVLDQFDISYAASFYGSMGDDYVTGTMVSIVPASLSGKSKKFGANLVTGSRGKYFSRYYADAVPLSESLLSPEAISNPYLSFRLVRPNEKSNRSFRFVSHYDSDERFYDTCLPDFSKCLAANSAAPWASLPSAAALWWPSPYVTVDPFSNTGYITFNNPYRDDEKQSIRDPYSDNDWTWSYPYENRYSPESRLITPEKKLGIDTAEYGFNGTTYEKLSVPKKFNGLIPILPGRNPIKNRFSGSRSGLRFVGVLTGSAAADDASYFLTAPSTDARQDDFFGSDYILPGDVYFDKEQKFDYITYFNGLVPPWSQATKPVPAPLTGTMTYKDTVKFLFGFGDLNNMAYGYKQLDLSVGLTGTITERFESISAKTPAYSIPASSLDDVAGLDGPVFKFNWSASPTANAWTVVNQNATLGSYNFFAYPTPPGPPPPVGGVYWTAADGGNRILVSDNDVANGGSMIEPPSLAAYTTSIACVDITSSVPWSLKYKRAVNSHTSDGLFTYFSSIPGFPTLRDSVGQFTPFWPLEFVRGNVATPGGSAYEELTQFDLMSEGSTDTYPVQISTLLGYTTSSFVPNELPLTPGEYRLCFAFIKSGSLISVPDGAAIDNLEVKYWLPKAYSDMVNMPKAGANNYPEFRKTVGDARHRPIPLPSNTYPYNEPSIISGSAAAYSSYNYSVSPIIRGWKYGLYSGFSQNTKAVFRRDKYGQFRDMLEQRQYSKFVSVQRSPTDDEAITFNNEVKEKGEKPDPVGQTGNISPSPVTVNFVRQRLTRDERGIGDIYNESVQPSLTYSQNLSYEVTSSLPYFDGIARHRSEEELKNVKNFILTSVSIGPSGITVT